MKYKIAIAILVVLSASSCAKYNRTAMLNNSFQAAVYAEKHVGQLMYRCYNVPEREQKAFFKTAYEACLIEYTKPMPELMTYAELDSVSRHTASCAIVRLHNKYHDDFTVDKLSREDAEGCLQQRDGVEALAAWE